MTTLGTNITEDGVGSGVQVTGACQIMVPKTAVLGGAMLRIEVWPTDVADNYVPIPNSQLSGGGVFPYPGIGTYFLRYRLENAQSNTSIPEILVHQ